MKEVLPVFYSEYGRYISKFRAIPLFIDCLKPVERRSLYGAYEIARNKLVKTAKIIGHVIGNYHPHGDQAMGSVFANLVHNKYLSDKGGTWGGIGLKDFDAASPRYTETKLEKWVDDLAFELIKFTPFEQLELDPEPLFLPSPIPLGLIGDGVISGIGFHKTVIPKYKIEDLAKRLLFLIDNNLQKPIFDGNKTTNLGPCIKPCKNDCDAKELTKDYDFYNILINGIGDVVYTPKFHIKKTTVNKNNKKINVECLFIEGRSPLTSYERLNLACSNGKIPVAELPTDLSKEMNVNICIEPKKGLDINEFTDTIINKYCTKKISFCCLTSDFNGKVNQIGIDDILIENYKKWIDVFHTKLQDDINQVNKNIIQNEVCSQIKSIIVKYNVNYVDEIVKKFNFNIPVSIEEYNSLKWNKKSVYITEDMIINICNTTSIKKLVEFKSQKTELTNEFNNIKDKIINSSKITREKIENIQTNGISIN